MPSTGATPPKLQPPTVAEIMEHAEGDDLDKSHPVNGLSYSDTSSRSSSDGPTNTTASTGCRARLAHVFTLQIFLLLGCFGGTLSYLFISLRNEIDSDVNRIVVGSMDQYEEALTPPLHTTMNMLTMLHLLLPYLNETVPTIGNISDVMRMLPTFAEYRRALMQMEFAAYVYEDFRSADNDPVTGEPVWSEVVCAPLQCYVTVNNTAAYYNLAANEGYLPNNFSVSALQNVTYGALVVYREGFYINQIRSIPVGRMTGVWGVPYVWLEESSQVPYVLQPLQSCWAWNMTLDGGRGECIHSISIEINLQLLIEGLGRITAGRAESTALVHMNSMMLLSSTFEGLPLVNMSGITDLSPYQGTSQLTHHMWNAENTPNDLLNSVVATFDRQCVSNRTLAKVVNDTIKVYALEYSCETIVVNIDDKIVGLKLIVVDSDSQFLFVDVTPRDYFYSSVDHALRNTIIVAVVVCSVAVLIVALLFYSVSSAMQSLLDNIMVAESLDYEGVTETSMILYETQRVHDAFLALNARLLQTRAFLPQSIFEKSQKDGGSPLILPPSQAALRRDGGATDVVPRASASEDVGFSNTEDEEGANPLVNKPSDDNKLEDGQQDHEGRSTAGVSFATSVVDHKSVPTSAGMYPRPRRLNLSSSLASRRVTVAYGNMVGSSSLFPDRGAQVAQKILGDVLSIIETAVTAQRGVIDLYHGDRVMVSFNASTVLTSSGPRAARAILQIEKAIEDLANPSMPAVRWGVSTGNAVVGNFGTNRTRRFCVCGPVVNQAFALMLHCRAEGVLNLVAPLTYDLIKDDFVVEHRNFVALTMGGTVNTVPAVISTILREQGDRFTDCDQNSGDDDDNVKLNNEAFEHLERGELDDAGRVCDMLPPYIGVRLRQILGRSAQSA